MPSHTFFLTFLFLPSLFFWYFSSCYFLTRLLYFLLFLPPSSSSLLCTTNAFFILPTVMGFTILPLNYFWSGVSVLPGPPTGLLAAQPTPLPYVGYTTSHSQKKGVFVLFSCLPWRSPQDKDWAFSLTNSHGMHLVIPTHLYPFWVVCHPSRTFSRKELWVGIPK